MHVAQARAQKKRERFLAFGSMNRAGTDCCGVMTVCTPSVYLLAWPALCLTSGSTLIETIGRLPSLFIVS